MKKIKYYILAIFFVLTLCLVPVGRVSALSDQVYTVTSTGDLMFCANDISSVVDCTGYKYLLIETNFGVNIYNASSSLVYFINNNSTNTYLSLNSPSVILDIDGFTRLRLFTIQGSSNLPSGWSITYTLSESNPYATGITPEGNIDLSSNGTFDVTNYATATIDVPSDLPPYSQLVVDSFWQYHTAFAGAIVAIIAIFLVYRLIKGRLR